MVVEENYMRRCFQLARLGAQYVAPNPMVGAVLVYNNRIIGEGYHHQVGGAHAEVEAVRSVASVDRPLIPHSTLYVSLEPCCIHGRTPACTDLILQEHIPRVVVSVLDQTEAVSGRGIELLRQAGVEVRTGILEEEGKKLAAFRNTLTGQKRPYVILKYAQSIDGYLGRADRPVWLTNPVSKRLVHKWRSEVSAILVGTNTAVLDQPRLTNRLYFGPSPLRVILDRQLRIKLDNPVLAAENPTLVVTEKAPPEIQAGHISYLPLDFSKDWLSTMLRTLAEKGISSLLVEGGAKTLEAFYQQQIWDEIRVFTSSEPLYEGIVAPKIPMAKQELFKLGKDLLTISYPKRDNR